MTKIETKELSKKIEEEIKQGNKGCIIRPSVAVIQIGDNEISNIHTKLKEEACNRVGIYYRYFKYEEDTPELTIVNKIKELNNDDYVNGIMLELPIPDKYNEKRLLNSILNTKDIDGLTDVNIGRLISGRKTFIPCTVAAIMTIIKENDIDLEGKEVVVIGKGKLVGRPIIYQLLNAGATVTVCHSRTEDLKKHTLEADVIISAAGVKDLITEDMVKDGVVVIDVGCSIEDGKVYGDVDPKVEKKASMITSKTGCIGTLSIAMFLKNVMNSYNNKK
jgi:methylenetetrahydrofolate dehydrogenase (NADP+)/methenyltetrahydrofolate cyclohydrolase